MAIGYSRTKFYPSIKVKFLIHEGHKGYFSHRLHRLF